MGILGKSPYHTHFVYVCDDQNIIDRLYGDKVKCKEYQYYFEKHVGKKPTVYAKLYKRERLFTQKDSKTLND